MTMRRRECIMLLGGAAARGRSWRARSSPSGCGGLACSRAGLARTRKHASRHSLRHWHSWAGPTAKTCGSKFAGAGRCRRHTQAGDRIGGARAGRHHGRGRYGDGAVAAGDPHGADRVCNRAGSSRLRFRRKPARPGGNATGFLQFEYGLSGKWLELLKEISAGPDASSGPAGHHRTRRHRPVCRYPILGSVAWGGR